jgi:membrane protein YdbS with pleckstrin-like domain
MIPLNTPEKLPTGLKWYALAKLVAVLFLISIVFMFFGENVWWPMFLFMLFIIGLPVWIYAILSYKYVSFVVAENTLTINSGIFVKHSNAIPFNQVQNATNTKGPLASLFGFSKLNIWTASPSQIQVQRGNTDNKPTGMLVIKFTDAEWLKGFILGKRS